MIIYDEPNVYKGLYIFVYTNVYKYEKSNACKKQ